MYNIKCLTKTEQAEIVKYYNAGAWSQKDLAHAFDVSVDTIRKVLKNAEESKRSSVKIEADSTTFTITGTVEINAPTVVKQPEIIWNASSKFISITVDSVTYNATPKTHDNFQEILQLLVDGELEEAATKINIRKAVEKYISGNVRIEGGSLF